MVRQVVMVNDTRLSEGLGGLEVVVVVSERHLDNLCEGFESCEGELIMCSENLGYERLVSWKTLML